MFEFNHVSLQNPGVTTGLLPSNIYTALFNEISEIKSNFDNHERWNYGLAGNIERQYKLQKSIPSLSPYLNEMCKSYAQKWNFYKKEGDYELTSLWVNYQKKHEFNPIHHHSYNFSFVIWMNIPYKVVDEMNSPMVKETNAKAASSFQFVYTNIIGNLSVETLYVDHDWSGRILLFPSQLSHCVYPFYTSNEYRISVSGNLA